MAWRRLLRSSGLWKITVQRVSEQGDIHAWIERDGPPSSKFQAGDANEEMTLTVPGTDSASSPSGRSPRYSDHGWRRILDTDRLATIARSLSWRRRASASGPPAAKPPTMSSKRAGPAWPRLMWPEPWRSSSRKWRVPAGPLQVRRRLAPLSGRRRRTTPGFTIGGTDTVSST